MRWRYVSLLSCFYYLGNCLNMFLFTLCEQDTVLENIKKNGKYNRLESLIAVSTQYILSLGILQKHQNEQ